MRQGVTLKKLEWTPGLHWRTRAKARVHLSESVRDPEGADLAKERVLITGASGFLGTEVLAELSRSGVECHAVSRRPRVPEENHPAVTWHWMDLLTDPTSWHLARIRPTHCIHLAWEATPGRYRQSLGSYDWVAATLRLARNFFSSGGRHFTMAGSCLEYASSANTCDETDTPLGGDCAYANCKIETSRLLAALARDCRATFADARIFYLYGPGEPEGKLIRSICQGLLEGRPIPLTDGTDFVDFIYRSDAAKALVALTRAGFNGPVNIGTGRGILVRDLATRLGEIAGRTELLQFGNVPLGRDPVRIVAATKRLTLEVGYRPVVDIDQGLHSCYKFWAAQGVPVG
ncbi:MAG TPA: NAD(P)-dependent oxidoreductase [Candidatus Acidoferrales bacterium]|nr:NAD(P)-dependent oxidoreductase [Candidatus Acidoferrales bacterium]